MKNFKVGDRVRWTTKAGGLKQSHRGIVLAKVPEYVNAQGVFNMAWRRNRFLKPASHHGFGKFGRKGVSYLVRKDNANLVFWPKVELRNV